MTGGYTNHYITAELNVQGICRAATAPHPSAQFTGSRARAPRASCDPEGSWVEAEGALLMSAFSGLGFSYYEVIRQTWSASVAHAQGWSAQF